MNGIYLGRLYVLLLHKGAAVLVQNKTHHRRELITRPSSETYVARDVTIARYSVYTHRVLKRGNWTTDAESRLRLVRNELIEWYVGTLIGR